MAADTPNVEIAAALNLTADTVGKHVVRAHQALGALSRAHATALGSAHGLVRPEDIQHHYRSTAFGVPARPVG
ncbi:helix-turn-helix domain-containing protein [Peterkaempfera griseoplana]|uniref:hypothetical protein n=1 Tax=Peterkaempfera griseoplana TaxID=66896 RepID=UPI000AB1A5D5